MIDRRRFITISSASAAAALVPASSVNAQIAGNAFIVSGFPPGGMGDLVARPLAEKMRGRYATNVLVDSKVGAGGRIAAEFVKRADSGRADHPADPRARSWCSIRTSTAICNYDPLTDFVPVTHDLHLIVFVHREPGAAGRDPQPSPISSRGRAPIRSSSSYGIPAAGSSLHFAGMMLQRAAEFEFTAVPYRGGAPLLTDMLAGAIPVSFNVIGEVLPHIQSGKLRSLGG